MNDTPRARPTVTETAATLAAAARGIGAPDPFSGVATRALVALEPTEAPRRVALLEAWTRRSPGNPNSEMRYRWEINHRRGVPLPPFSPPTTAWRAWRTAEQSVLERDPFAFEERLAVPVAICHNIELLAELADSEPAAAELLAEVTPIARRDLAVAIQGQRPWPDTFALWCVSRSPRALARLHSITLALATAYSASVVDDSVQDLRFPYHEVPLASATAHLASAHLALGTDLGLAARLCASVAARGDVMGSWSDGAGPADLLTTLVCADLMIRIDPDFDPSPTRDWLLARANRGLFWVLGPDAPWLTWELLGWLRRAAQPFGERFVWPYLAEANRDRKTGLPFFSDYAALSELFATIPGLARSRVQLAFFDLIGFRDFNNQQGQQRGDEVLACFARWLEEVPAARAIRDGGDEFLLVGAPQREGLRGELEQRLTDWTARYRAHFGAGCPLVVPRVLVGSVRGVDLMRGREQLGREVGALKHARAGKDGLLVDAGPLVP